MGNTCDCAIIGGGVIGLSAAYFLAKEGLRVRVLDKSDMGQESSWAGAGIITPGSSEAARTPLERIRALGSSLYPALSEELRDRTGLDNGYRRSGGIEFVPEGSPATDEWRAEGISFEPIDERALSQLEPHVRRPPGAAYLLPDMAQVRNPRHLKSLLAGCQALGVTLTAGCPALGFVRQGNRVVAIKSAIGEVSAGHIILAAGAWTDSLLAEIGFHPGIHPVRGQIALLSMPEPLFRRLLLVGPRYLVPRGDGRVLIGSTDEDVGYDKRTTSGAIRDLLDFALELVPGLAAAALERSWAGLRPGSPDGLPFLGPVPGLDNLLVAAGHFRGGIQLAPVTAVLLKELVLGQAPCVPLGPFRLDRPVAPRRGAAFRS